MKLLAAFLEKDNLKLLVYDGKTRVFAGQISFSSEVVKDAFIADSSKFSSQVKVAFAQKPALKEISSVVLFLPPDKTFTKTLPAQDSVDSFVQSLPYFAEELILTSSQQPATSNQVTHVAFEKKLIEDLERPFLESGKKILGVRGLVNDLVLNYPGEGEYFLLAATEKDIVFAVATGGALAEAGEFKMDIFFTRFGEYLVNHNLSHIRKAVTIGAFPAELAEKMHHAQNLEVSSLAEGDIYDLVVAAFLKLTRKSWPLPSQRVLFAVGAAVIGFFLILTIVKNLPQLGAKKKELVSPVATPAGQTSPETKPADFKVRVLNGTLVEGEAGRLTDKIKKDKGFEIVEVKNATSSGFVTTKLRVEKSVPDKITSLVKSLLEETYQSIFVEPLASDSAGVKIEIIIGKKK